MLGRRLLVLFAVLLGLTALVTSLAPRPTITRPGLAQPTTTPAPTETQAPATGQLAPDREDDLGRRRARPRPQIRARVGDVLGLTVKGDVLDSVEIEDAGKLEPIEPGSPARFELLLDRRGELRVDLVDAERLIGLVEVSPAARAISAGGTCSFERITCQLAATGSRKYGGLR